MDSINAVTLSDNEFDELFYSDGYAVIKVESLDEVSNFTYNQDEIIELQDSSGYLVPSKDITDAQKLGNALVNLADD